MMALSFHPDRDGLFNELHARPFPVLLPGTTVSQLALLHDGVTAEAERAHWQQLCLRLGFPAPPADSTCHHLDFGAFELRWERHTELSTWTIIRPPGPSAAPFTQTALSLLPAAWLAALPGRVISGLHIDLRADLSPETDAEQIRPAFEGHRLISSWVIDRRARVWTAWRLHSDGLGRCLVLNDSLNPCQLGRLVRRLLELETYRMMVLLAFPLARQMAPELDQMNTQLVTVGAQLNAIQGLDDERRLLGDLSQLSARLEQWRAASQFRFSAARAYHELVLNRLSGLREQEEPGLQTLGEFLLRRLTPAFRTGEAICTQLESLAQRIDRASDLLRTRIDLALEAQNQDLLLSMNRRAHMQLQLQQAVEGFSVVAITYYGVGLVSSLAKSFEALGYLNQAATVSALSVPVILGLVAWGVRRLRRRLVV